MPTLQDVDRSRLNHAGRMLYEDIVFLVKVFFFVYLGLSKRLEGLDSFLIPLLIVIVISVARLHITTPAVSRECPWSERSVVSVMVPKGLTVAVLAGLPAPYGNAEAALSHDTVYRTFLIRIVLLAALAPLIDRVPAYRRSVGAGTANPAALVP